jgi:DNA replication protein DnaC
MNKKGNRYRKRLCPKEYKEDLRSNNIMIIGNSGSGKTEVLIHHLDPKASRKNMQFSFHQGRSCSLHRGRVSR